MSVFVCLAKCECFWNRKSRVDSFLALAAFFSLFIVFICFCLGISLYRSFFLWSSVMRCAMWKRVRALLSFSLTLSHVAACIVYLVLSFVAALWFICLPFCGFGLRRYNFSFIIFRIRENVSIFQSSFFFLLCLLLLAFFHWTMNGSSLDHNARGCDSYFTLWKMLNVNFKMCCRRTIFSFSFSCINKEKKTSLEIVYFIIPAANVK